MVYIESFFRKYEYVLLILLFIVASLYLSWDANRQLVDYDEATYAQVVTETLQTGNFITFQLHDKNWFEKPPLYLWMAMGFVKIFGEHEFAFRLPSIIFSILCYFLVYYIVRELTGNKIAAAFGFLILLFSNAFFLYAREARLDSAVIAAILMALLFHIKGWRNKKYLLLVFPAIAVGILFKSVIALLALPIIFIYSFTYSNWSNIKSKYLWIGLLFALFILVPWHFAETIKFGHIFWDSYLTTQVFQRATTTLTGSNGYYDFIELFWPWYLPWNIVLIIGLITISFLCKFLHLNWRETFVPIITPLSISVFIFIVFTLARTHLAPYIMPAFPFFAISIAMIYHLLYSFLKNEKINGAVWIKVVWIILSISVLIGAIFCIYLMPAKVPAYTKEEMEIGKIYKEQNIENVPLYLFDWPYVETLNYYGMTRAQLVSPADLSDKEIDGPFYLVTSPPGVTYFFYDLNTPAYPGLKLLYFGEYFTLIYSDRTMIMPKFQYVPR